MKLDEEIIFKGYEGRSKCYIIFGYKTLISFGTYADAPYGVWIQTHRFLEHFETEDAALKWATKYAKKKFKERKKIEKHSKRNKEKEKYIENIFNCKESKWEKELKEFYSNK